MTDLWDGGADLRRRATPDRGLTRLITQLDCPDLQQALTTGTDAQQVLGEVVARTPTRHRPNNDSPPLSRRS